MSTNVSCMSTNVSCQSQRLWMVSQYNEFRDGQKVLLSERKFYALVAGFGRSNRWPELVKDNHEKALFGLTEGKNIPISITNTMVGFIQCDGTSKLEREYNNDRMVRQLFKQENESFDYSSMAVLLKSVVFERKNRSKLLLNGFFRESCAIWGVSRSTQKRIPPGITRIIAGFLFMETDTNNNCLDIQLKKCGLFCRKEETVEEAWISAARKLPILMSRATIYPDEDLKVLKTIGAVLQCGIGAVLQYRKNMLSHVKSWILTLVKSYPSLSFKANVKYIGEGLFAMKFFITTACEDCSITFTQKEMEISLKQQIEELKFIAKWPDNMTGMNHFVKILEAYTIASSTIKEEELQEHDSMHITVVLDESNTISAKDWALCESHLKKACWDAEDLSLNLLPLLIKNRVDYNLILECCRYEVKTNTVTIELKKYHW